MAIGGDLLRKSLATIERLEARIQGLEQSSNTAFAIVGAGCRFPGGVQNLDDLWRLVANKVDAVSEIPADRWDVDAHYDPDPRARGKMTTKRGGFLADVRGFEPQLFGISPREAAMMDPQHRLLLETTWEALESAAIPTDQLAGSTTGVFVGITTSDYGYKIVAQGPEHADLYAATGNALNAAAGRIAFTLGLQGPCVAVDTACSSSLVAVHLACQSLRSRESDLALAGGVNVILSPYATILFSKWGMMAPDGACKTFDAAADGFVRSEGCAVIAIKRLADALAARDPILAVIRGTAMNSDGRSSGLTVPNGPAQRALLTKALASARLEPADVDYVEAHGTGTSLGDPIEAEALGEVMRYGRPPERPLLIGSIKTNIGHSESASGIAGLLKVVVALRNEAIPAHLHFSTPNPAIAWSDLALSVPTGLVPWKRGARPRRAGVSAFGVSGTNAHAVLEEAPAAPHVARSVEPETVVVPLSAREDGALRAIAARIAQFAQDDAGASLHDLAVTAATGRTHLGRRVAIVADSKADLVRDLRAFAEGQAPPSAFDATLRAGERPKWAFLFTGQGTQYAGMGRGLYESEPVFRSTVDRAAKLLEGHLARPLLGVLFPKEGELTPLGETAYTQPALFALEYALAELWRSWGITPSAVLGHSVGEYVAAAVAGVMTFEEGLLLVADRARLMQGLPSGGAMAAVFASESLVVGLIARASDRLAIAAVNGPQETVVSGDERALAELVVACTAEGIACRSLEVSHAFHSPRLGPMLDAFEERAAAVPFEVPRIALVSNLTGSVFGPGARPDAAYWRRHAREPVRFAAGVEALGAAGVTGLIELGPHPTLLGLATRCAPRATWTTAASLRRGQDDRREMLSALGKLYAQGAAVAWEGLYRDGRGRRIAMPTYPFQRERHWLDESPAAPRRGPTGHPLLGEHRELASPAGTHVWETAIGVESHPWLRDHRVQGTVVVPASAYLEMALAAAGELHPGAPLVIREIQNLKPFVLDEGGSRTLQVSLVVQDGSLGRFAVHSRGDGGAWTAHVHGQVGVEPATNGAVAPGLEALDAIKRRCARELAGADFYATFAEKGNEWGPCFQGLKRVWLGDDEALGEVRIPPAVAADAHRYSFHPAVSDACAHVLVAAASLAREGAFVGGGVDEVRFRRSPAGGTLWVHARLRREGTRDERVVIGDLRVLDEQGPISETLGARIVYLDSAGLEAPKDWLYEVRWKGEGVGGPGERAADGGAWIVFADQAGVAHVIAALREAAGRRAVLVTTGDRFSLEGDRATVRPSNLADLRRLFEAVPAPAAVLHLASMSAPFKDALSAGPEGVVSLLHALLGAPAGHRPRLWLLTADTQRVVPADRCDTPFGAILWGLGRALSAEHAELWGGLIDVQATDPVDRVAEQVIREVETGGTDDQLAFRGGQRYVARLERRAPAVAGGDFSARLDGTYLVTGGLGGIGLAVAKWLVERGARHLLLVGRNGLPPRDAWDDQGRSSAPLGRRIAAIRDLEALGARVEVVGTDVAQEGALEGCLDARRARGEPPVRGVMHAAGVVQAQALAAQDVAGLRGVLAAKVDGGWGLHRSLANAPLDFFVLFSSSSALLRSPRLGAYAGGNAFLDALAHHRRARGLPALSVNWGTWGDVGVAAASGRVRDGDLLTGMGAIPTSRGLAALGALLAADETQAAVMPIDWGKLARAYPAFARDPFVASLIGDSAPAVDGAAVEGASSVVRAASAAERSVRLAVYLRGVAARALGMTVDSLDPDVPLSALGFDSLMAVQLKNQVEADLGVVVPMIRLLDAPKLNQLLPLVLEAMAGVAPSLPAGAVASGDAWEEGSI
jgi:acyl transferase domain-containing protein